MFMRVVKVITVFAGLLTVTACSIVGGAAAPEPKYTVSLSEPPFEIREYGALVVVKTTMADGSRAAFGRLFDYISGQNKGTRKIAMTAPVLNTSTAEGTQIAMTAPTLQTNEGREMIFVLADEFTSQTAPVPTDPKVKLATIATRQVAVVTYTGSMTKGAPAKEARLRAWVEGKQFKIIGPPEVAGYNPPWTLPAYRRNEVMIPIEIEK